MDALPGEIKAIFESYDLDKNDELSFKELIEELNKKYYNKWSRNFEKSRRKRAI